MKTSYVNMNVSPTQLAVLLCLIGTLFLNGISAHGQSPVTNGASTVVSGPIVLVAGEVTKKDKVGHHDYLAGCKCLEILLRQTPDVEVVVVADAWPSEASVLEKASAIVFYCDGGGKQPFLASRERTELLDRLSKQSTGLVFIHQAVDFPAEHAERAKKWLGGVYVAGKSGRGHWPSSHVDFPNHPVTRGVTPWKVNDGWLNQLDFVPEMKGITPLVWSGKQYQGSRSGLDADVVGWVYERPAGGRSFSFSGLDAHTAWSLAGMRQLVVNGILWSAGHKIPEQGAACTIEEAELSALQTPRESK